MLYSFSNFVINEAIKWPANYIKEYIPTKLAEDTAQAWGVEPEPDTSLSRLKNDIIQGNYKQLLRQGLVNSAYFGSQMVCSYFESYSEQPDTFMDESVTIFKSHLISTVVSTGVGDIFDRFVGTPENKSPSTKASKPR